MARVRISCLCGKVRTAVLLTDAIPVQSSICHQSQCRYNLGALCHSALPIKAPPGEPVLENLSVYEPQPGLRRYFCPICGSHCFQNDVKWKVQSGVVEGIHSEQVFDKLEMVVDQAFVHETIDGGLSACLGGLEDRAESRLLQPFEFGSTFLDRRCPALATFEASNHDDHSRLMAKCLCGGVEFYLTRPDAGSSRCSSPWPDLIVPYYKHSNENPEDVKWWICHPRRWLAGLCACRSCRLGLGYSLQAWAFVSRTNLYRSDGTSFTYNSGMLQSFESSPGATREFCSRCGATIFWHNTQRPGVVDISVGILRASEGVLAKSWLRWWTDRISFSEDAVDKNVIGTLQYNWKKLEQNSP